MIGMQVIPAQAAMPKVTDAFDGVGRLVRADALESVEALADSLVLTLAPAEPVAA
jgi:hypothetical protein